MLWLLQASNVASICLHLFTSTPWMAQEEVLKETSWAKVIPFTAIEDAMDPHNVPSHCTAPVWICHIGLTAFLAVHWELKDWLHSETLFHCIDCIFKRRHSGIFSGVTMGFWPQFSCSIACLMVFPALLSFANGCVNSLPMAV